MSLRRAQNDELSKLRILEFLSNPQKAGIIGEGHCEVTKEDMSYLNGVRNVERILSEMTQAGLVVRQETLGRRSKPYFITDHGRRHLEQARQEAMRLRPGERRGWADDVGSDSLITIANFIRSLPEFAQSDEQRIQQVSRALVEGIEFPAPEHVSRGPERSSR